MPRPERNWAVFNQLRDILMLRDDELPRGSRCAPLTGSGPAATVARLQAIETAAEAYHDSLRQRVGDQPPRLSDDRPEAVVLAYHYTDALVAQQQGCRAKQAHLGMDC